MTLRTVPIIGESGVGKSTLLKSVRAELGPGERIRYGLFEGESYPRQQLMLGGIWHTSTRWPGGDQLHGGASEWLGLLIRDHLQLLGAGWTIAFEGFYLITSTLLGLAFERSDCHLVHLWAPRTVLDQRLIARGTPQGKEQGLGYHEHDCELCERFPNHYDWRHVSGDDIERNQRALCALLDLGRR